MSEPNQQVERLIIVKSKLKIALDTNNKEDTKRYFEEFKALYEETTSKKFDDTVSPEVMSKIESVLNGTIEIPNIRKAETEDERDF